MCLIFLNLQCLKNTRLRPQKWCKFFVYLLVSKMLGFKSSQSDFTRILHKWSKSNFNKTKIGVQ